MRVLRSQSRLKGWNEQIKRFSARRKECFRFDGVYVNVYGVGDRCLHERKRGERVEKVNWREVATLWCADD